PASHAFCTLALHDALPIYVDRKRRIAFIVVEPAAMELQAAKLVETTAKVEGEPVLVADPAGAVDLTVQLQTAAQVGERRPRNVRSEEHTSELQSRFDLVSR